MGEGFGEILTYLDGRKYAVQLSDDDLPGLSHYRFRLNKLGAVPSFTPATDVLIVGCGLGWLLETFIDYGSNSVWGTDISTLIQTELSNPDMNVRADTQARILNINVQDPNASQQFKTAGAGDNKGKFNWLVTEHVLEDWSLSTIDTLFDDLDGLRGNGPGGVAHIVVAQDKIPPSAIQNPTIMVNQLTLAEWAFLRPSHWWLDEVTGDIAGGQ
jgi:hypothetical protein